MRLRGFFMSLIFENFKNTFSKRFRKVVESIRKHLLYCASLLQVHFEHNNCREDINFMSVANEVSQGVKNPTRKQAWSVVGIVALSVTTSLLTPVVVSQIRKLTKGKK